PEEFGEVVASGKTTRFGFDDPFPVYVAYWTVVPDSKGGVKKLADIYGRDAPVVASFAKPGRAAALRIAPTPPDVVPTGPTTVTAPGTPGIDEAGTPSLESCLRARRRSVCRRGNPATARAGADDIHRTRRRDRDWRRCGRRDAQLVREQ